jgi:hypothetical protein
METTWTVEQVTEKPCTVTAELRQVDWFKKNPERAALDAEYDKFVAAHSDEEANEKYLSYEWPEEFIEARPGDEGAEYIDGHGRLTLDITEGPELHAGDDVMLTVQVVSSVDA